MSVGSYGGEGAGEYGMNAYQGGSGFMSDMGGYGGSSSYGGGLQPDLGLGSRWSLSRYWQSNATDLLVEAKQNSSGSAKTGYGVGYGESGSMMGGMGGQSYIAALNIMPEFISKNAIKQTVRIEAPTLKNIPLLREIHKDQFPIAGMFWYPKNISSKQFRLVTEGSDGENSTVLEKVKVLGFSTSQYSNFSKDNETYMHLLMSVSKEGLAILKDDINQYSATVVKPIYRARAIDEEMQD